MTAAHRKWSSGATSYHVPMQVFAGSSGERGSFAAGAQVGYVPAGGFFGRRITG
jgi:hypothetical protein